MQKMTDHCVGKHRKRKTHTPRRSPPTPPPWSLYPAASLPLPCPKHLQRLCRAPALGQTHHSNTSVWSSPLAWLPTQSPCRFSLSPAGRHRLPPHPYPSPHLQRHSLLLSPPNITNCCPPPPHNTSPSPSAPRRSLSQSLLPPTPLTRFLPPRNLLVWPHL